MYQICSSTDADSFNDSFNFLMILGLYH